VAFDLPRSAIIDKLRDIEAKGLEMPLVLRVQSWLAQEGVVLESPIYSMAELIAELDRRMKTTGN